MANGRLAMPESLSGKVPHFFMSKTPNVMIKKLSVLLLILCLAALNIHAQNYKPALDGLYSGAFSPTKSFQCYIKNSKTNLEKDNRDGFLEWKWINGERYIEIKRFPELRTQFKIHIDKTHPGIDLTDTAKMSWDNPNIQILYSQGFDGISSDGDDIVMFYSMNYDKRDKSYFEFFTLRNMRTGITHLLHIIDRIYDK